MNRILENERLKIEISDHGAELVRIYDKKKEREVLYNGNPAYWNRHAPILFPFVGCVSGGTYQYKGKDYKIGQHGFARDSEFAFVSCDGTSCVHRLTDSPESREKYPFPFSLTVSHELTGSVLHVDWEVKAGDEPLLFKIGAHPAFVVPAEPGKRLSNYYLFADGRDSLTYHLISPGTGCVNPEDFYELTAKSGFFRLSEEMFENDALILDGPGLSQITLCHPDRMPYVSVSCNTFPYLGIWKKPGAPFVCLEPWDGRTDNVGAPADLEKKSGMISLAPGEVYRNGFVITIYG